MYRASRIWVRIQIVYRAFVAHKTNALSFRIFAITFILFKAGTYGFFPTVGTPVFR